MNALLLPVAAASLMGSLHCAGMCGPLAAFYAGNDVSRGRARAGGHLAYHLARLVAYGALGALGGGLGHALDLAGTAAGLGRVAGLVAGATMIGWALLLLLEHLGVPGVRLAPPQRLVRVAQPVFARLRARPPLLRAALIGLCSAMLPCGWLYAFAVVAAGTGSALSGAALMAAFWAGTVPLLLGVALGVQSLGARLRRHVPVLSALVLLTVGIVAVVGRLNAPALAAGDVKTVVGAGSSLPELPPCHRGGGHQ